MYIQEFSHDGERPHTAKGAVPGAPDRGSALIVVHEGPMYSGYGRMVVVTSPNCWYRFSDAEWRSNEVLVIRATNDDVTALRDRQGNIHYDFHRYDNLGRMTIENWDDLVQNPGKYLAQAVL